MTETPTQDLLEAVNQAKSTQLISASTAEHLQVWLTDSRYQPFLPQVAEHIQQEQWSELEEVFWTVIPFGTAGRRGKMYPIGTNAINEWTMGESAQGLANYLTKTQPEPPSLSCAIGYDSRHGSRDYAELCAEIMLAAGFEVYFLNQIRSTPELACTVRHKQCDCGIMITASHNPPEDNAIKVFWSTGGQIRPPEDVAIIKEVQQVEQIQRSSFQTGVAEGKVIFCETEMDQVYQDFVLQQAQPGPRELSILYSPLHGVGLTSVLPILERDGFKNVEVYAPHQEPNGDFPNVPNHIANPEDPQVFEALIEHAQQNQTDLILASDPDADRLGCATRLAADQAWQTLTGNQIGVLLAEFLLRKLQQQGKLTPEHFLIKTLVTTDMLFRIAEAYEIQAFGEVLTGFKWIGSLIDEHDPEKFILGTEEAHGYLAGTHVRDKDGAVAAMLLAEYAAEAKSRGRTLHQELDDLYHQYGLHLEFTIAQKMPGSQGMQQMKAIMQQLRTSIPQGWGEFQVKQLRDYLEQTVTTPGGQAQPFNGPQSDLLIFDFEQAGNRLAVRPSGTEPKIKFYFFGYQPVVDTLPLTDQKADLNQRLQNLSAELLNDVIDAS